jgi:gamma-glutamylcyclotransferase (GGCT)/AIG2-like uncharacterized protein YtfP
MNFTNKNTNKLYAAYGSNLNLKQMERRCPYAIPLGGATLVGYRLMFRGGPNSVATVEPWKNGSVPVLIWEITPRCEKELDRYEGWPRLYRKETVSVNFCGKATEVMAYVMNEVYPYGLPSASYLDSIKDGYASASFDVAVLEAAVMASGMTKNCSRCGGKMVWENSKTAGHFHESSCNLDDWDICHDCMVEHCVSTNCLGCELGTYPDCRFFDLKQFYMRKG